MFKLFENFWKQTCNISQFQPKLFRIQTYRGYQKIISEFAVIKNELQNSLK